jgi:hypothetical protein
MELSRREDTSFLGWSQEIGKQITQEIHTSVGSSEKPNLFLQLANQTINSS